MVARGEGWESGRDMDTPLYLKWMTSKDLLYNTEFCSTLWASLDWRGAWGRKDTCMCVAEALPCSSETITALLISYTPT